MDNPEVVLFVDKSSEERAASRKSKQGSSKKWSTLIAEIQSDRAEASSFLLKWRKIFVTSCVFAVLLDPLFLYVPIISQDMTCLRLDENLKKAALILRSITDLFYIMDIIIQLHRSDCDKWSGLINKFRHRRSCCSKFQFIWKYFLTTIAKTIWWSYILIDILAILPLPQVLILHFFSKMRGSRSLNTRKFIMNSFVMMQYVPRVFRIYQLCKEPKKSVHEESTAIWVKGVLNLFLYILASHVLGAVWYFFAVQRMTICWQYACRNENKCDTSTFSCYDHGSLINIKLIKDICPIDPPNVKLFDFGIFLSLFQSGIPRSTSFLQKFSNCFCWGLRNLRGTQRLPIISIIYICSSLGSNLQPSTNTWENFFVAFVSIMGLLLFIYLIGNLQTYMQLETTRIESHRHKMKIKRKMQEIGPEIELWLSKSGLPKNPKDKIKSQIMEKVQQVLAENRNAGLDHIISILPLELRMYIKSFSPWNRLKQELVLQTMDEEVLKVICEHLKPMKYTKNNVIIQENEPLEMMLIIVEGLLSIEKRDYASNTQRGPTELCGEKLLTWPSSSLFPCILPTATESARAIDDVEALVLMADDMRSVGTKFRSQFTDYAKFKGRLAIHLENVIPAIRIYTAEELKKATNNYHESGIIGAGGSATIYKGILPNHETAVAIKKFKNLSESSYTQQQLIDEVILHSRMNHKNVVRLLGCCLGSEVPSMVCEFITNGTLYEHVHDKSEGSTVTLPLELRMKIAAETAGALAYLHSLTTPIIHRDVKTRNIMLDENYRAKLIDFGISRVFDKDLSHVSTMVKGSFGYLDPEYYRRQELTPKSDVYSFGVVLGELLTSRKALNREDPCKRAQALAGLLKSSVEKGRLDQILDQEIVNGENIETAKKVADLAYRCLRDSGVSRPSMKEVATELEGLVGVIANNQVNFP